MDVDLTPEQNEEITRLTLVAMQGKVAIWPFISDKEKEDIDGLLLEILNNQRDPIYTDPDELIDFLKGFISTLSKLAVKYITQVIEKRAYLKERDRISRLN